MLAGTYVAFARRTDEFAIVPAFSHPGSGAYVTPVTKGPSGTRRPARD